MYKVIESNGIYELVKVISSNCDKEIAKSNAALFNDGQVNITGSISDWVLSNRDTYRGNKVTTELFEIALSAANIEIDPDITKQVLDVIDLLEKKGGDATLEELIKIGKSDER